MIRKKILLVGDFHVGKTSLIRRYVENSFDDKYLTTVGVKISKKKLIIEDTECELLIWDIEGSTPQKRIPENYLKGASGAIIVADVSRSDTVGAVKSHIMDLKRVNPDIAFVIAYNKIDLLTPLQHDSYPIEENAFLVSAKENIYVEPIFESLTRRILL